MKPFTVYIDDNYHYMDRDYRTTLGGFESLESAIDACKRIVDEYLAGDHAEGMSAEDLYIRYTMFGEDPFITGPGVTEVAFSAWNHAKEKAQIICDRAVEEPESRAPVPR